MIDINEKVDCCGCMACTQVCPKQCIFTNIDREGFSYPVVNKKICIDCGMCERVCPILKEHTHNRPSKIYAGINPDEEIRRNSSSGGAFTAISKCIIEQGGVVFGARFDAQWKVVHDFVETIDGLRLFQGSKYVQSDIGDSYINARRFLNDGRKVLFSGTPCQIAGLLQFLRRHYDNLLTLDVVCHGVPSPRVWEDYKKYILRPKGVAGKNTVLSSLKDMPFRAISFRDKRNGWKKFGFAVEIAALKAAKNSVLPSSSFYETVKQNAYLQGFIRDLYLRPSCYNCKFKSGKSHSDMTLADYWQIDKFYPELDDDKGVSLIMINTIRGEEILSQTPLQLTSTTYEQAYYGNHTIEESSSIPVNRAAFWRDYDKKGIKVINKHLPHATFMKKIRIKTRLVIDSIKKGVSKSSK